jgi:hypothetical protein
MSFKSSLDTGPLPVPLYFDAYRRAIALAQPEMAKEKAR